MPKRLPERLMDDPMTCDVFRPCVVDGCRVILGVGLNDEGPYCEEHWAQRYRELYPEHAA